MEKMYLKLGTVRTNSCEVYVASIGKEMTGKRFLFLN